jgi:hypothetical protein
MDYIENLELEDVFVKEEFLNIIQYSKKFFIPYKGIDIDVEWIFCKKEVITDHKIILAGRLVFTFSEKIPDIIDYINQTKKCIQNLEQCVMCNSFHIESYLKNELCKICLHDVIKCLLIDKKIPKSKKCIDDEIKCGICQDNITENTNNYLLHKCCMNFIHNECLQKYYDSLIDKKYYCIYCKKPICPFIYGMTSYEYSDDDN